MVGFNEDGYSISEEWSYNLALENGIRVTVKQADEAVGAIMYALQNNPFVFDVAYGDDVRVAHMAERSFDGLPPFRVFFRVNEDSKMVYLLHIDHG